MSSPILEPAHIDRRSTKNIRPKRKSRTIFPEHPKRCLYWIHKKPENWKRVVTELCRSYNFLHAERLKMCSKSTSESRERFYLCFFEFVADRFGADPRNLRSEHVSQFFKEKFIERLNTGAGPEGFGRFIENRVSWLRFFCCWIGKPGAVRKPDFYKAQVKAMETDPRASQTRASAQNIEILEERVLEAVRKCPFLGMQLFCMAYFGLRPKEALCLRPAEAFVLRNGEPALYIGKNCGSKGGRERTIYTASDSMRNAWQFAKSFCEALDLDSLIWPECTLRQGLKRQGRLLFKGLGLKRSQFSDSAYSFRHSFAQRLEKISESALGPQKASLLTAKALGHNREEITSVYLSSGGRAGSEHIAKLCRAIIGRDRAKETAQSQMIALARELFYEDPVLGASFAAWLATDAAQGSAASLILFVRAVQKGRPQTLSLAQICARFNQYLGNAAQTDCFLGRTAGAMSAGEVEKYIIGPIEAKLFSGM